MGTAGTIMVIGASGGVSASGSSVVRLFQYYDGYPEHVIPVIASALERLLAIHQVNSLSLTDDHQAATVAGTLYAESCAYLLMGAAVTRAGAGLKIDEDDMGDGRPRSAIYFNAPVVQQLGNDDVDWFYVVDLPARAVNVYSNLLRWFTASAAKPVAHLQAGLVSASQLRQGARARWADDAKARYADVLNAGVAAVEATGFAVNARLDGFGELLGLNGPAAVGLPAPDVAIDPAQHGLAPMF